MFHSSITVRNCFTARKSSGCEMVSSVTVAANPSWQESPSLPPWYTPNYEECLLPDKAGTPVDKWKIILKNGTILPCPVPTKALKPGWSEASIMALWLANGTAKLANINTHGYSEFGQKVSECDILTLGSFAISQPSHLHHFTTTELAIYFWKISDTYLVKVWVVWLSLNLYFRQAELALYSPVDQMAFFAF